MRMKKWLLIVLSIICCLSLSMFLTACGYKSESSASSSTDNSVIDSVVDSGSSASNSVIDSVVDSGSATDSSSSSAGDSIQKIFVEVSFEKYGGNGNAQSITVTLGEPYGSLPDELTKESAYFAGWFTGENGMGTLITSETVVKNENAHTLYAKWSALTEGLKYTLINNDTEYSVSIGTATDLDIIIPDTYNKKSVTEIENWAFESCNGLTSVTIPDSVISIGNCAFWYCSGLTEITIPDSVISIGDSAFVFCSGLTNAIISNSVTSIGDSAFERCSGLTNAIISNSVTSIGHSLFSGCSGLTSIIIPESVISIGDGAFVFCSGLTVYAEAASKPANWNSYWNNSARPVVWGCELSVDKAYVVSFTKTSASSISNPTAVNGISTAVSAANLNSIAEGTKVYAVWTLI